MRKLILLVLVIAVVAALPKLLDSKDPVAEVGEFLGLGVVKRTDATVLRVKDGDTIRVRVLKTGVESDVQILGILTPEGQDKPGCDAAEATAALRALLPVGATVALESDPSQPDVDGDDRFLRYVTASGRKYDFGLAQVRAGMAKVNATKDDLFDRVDAYRKAQRKARKGDVGLWAACWR